MGEQELRCLVGVGRRSHIPRAARLGGGKTRGGLLALPSIPKFKAGEERSEPGAEVAGGCDQADAV